MTFALFQAGWHWPLVACAVVAILAIIVVLAVGSAESEWLGEHRKDLRRLAWAAVLLVVLALLIGQLHKVEGMLRDVSKGDPLWLASGVALEALSFVGYVMLTWAVFRADAPRLTFRSAIEVTLGGVVATRLFSAAGAGGIAFTSWALRAAGMQTRTVAEKLAAFLGLMYAPYMLACLVGPLLGGVPDAVKWLAIVVSLAAFAAAAALALIPGDLERRARRVAAGHGRVARVAAKAASVPAVAGQAVRSAVSLALERPVLLLWASLWWAADVAVLDVCFRAFDARPALGVLITGYFLGHIGNLLPVPGGVGGVEGGMIGVFVACGMPLSIAILGTIAYQVISTWLPVAPGLGAYWSLRRRIARWREEDEAEDDPAALSGGGAPVPAASPH